MEHVPVLYYWYLFYIAKNISLYVYATTIFILESSKEPLCCFRNRYHYEKCYLMYLHLGKYVKMYLLCSGMFARIPRLSMLNLPLTFGETAKTFSKATIEFSIFLSSMSKTSHPSTSSGAFITVCLFVIRYTSRCGCEVQLPFYMHG